MSSLVDSCGESRGKACKAAHIGGCIAAIIAMLVIAPAKLGGYLPATMTSPRLLLFPVLAYGLGVAVMLWKLGRAIKRSRAMHTEAEVAATLPRRAG